MSRFVPRLVFLSIAFSLVAPLAVVVGCGHFEAEPETADVTGAERSLHAIPGAGAERAHHEAVVALLRASDAVDPPRPDVHPVRAVYNREAIIPPMCYTRTEGRHNPCYVCHQDALPERENVMDDADLQEAYSFSDLGLTNRWSNLFVDRSERVAAIPDEEIRAWVDQDNYSELAPRLREAGFEGFIPDLDGLAEGAAAFDDEGFARDGSGWVAYGYKPFPGTFWPTNGSTDDVMIRLPRPYRVDAEGRPSRDVYRANLAILEANMKGLEAVTTRPIDERRVGADLDDDGGLGTATVVRRIDGWVGGATGYFKEAFLYPEHTEFLHTVRYLSVDEDGRVGASRRMKEVRYMKKWKAFPKFVLAQYYLEEDFDKQMGRLPGYTDLGDRGLDNGMGWSIQGFIENRRGRLRVASYEENFFCMGCHNSIGSTVDKTFSFARKLDGAEGWGYIDLVGMPDAPNQGEQLGEIATYLQRAGGGGEFRSNPEMEARWFGPDGRVDLERVRGKDVYTLTVPSARRALELNKAYRVLVEDQSFLFGRDATVTPPPNVHRAVDPETAPTLPPEARHRWDIRLDWAAVGVGQVPQAPVERLSAR